MGRGWPEADREFAAMMGSLAELRGVEITEQRIRGYWHRLKGVPMPALRRAFGRLADRRTMTAFPQLSDIMGEVAATDEEAALLQWAGLLRAVENVGGYRSLECEDPRTVVAVGVVFGSWPALCDIEEGPGLTSRRREFEAAFRDAARRGVAGVGRLPGRVELGGGYVSGQARQHALCGYLAASGEVTVRRERPLLPGAAQGQLEGE